MSSPVTTGRSRAPRAQVFARVAGLTLLITAVLVLGGYIVNVRRPESGPRIRSLLVLPLDNISAEGGQDYLADGMTDALTTELAKIGSLRVISRTTAMQYKRERKPLAEIGRTLGVDAVVEGSVARTGNRVRVTAQLIQLNPETHLWGEEYDRTIDDAFTMHSDVTQAVARVIAVELSPDDRARLGRHRTVRPDAYEAYLRARYYESGAAGLATERAIATYKKAVELDSTFTAARAGLARAYIFGVGMRPKIALATARETAMTALTLDPGAPEAMLASAITRLYNDHDFMRADEEFRRALADDPGNADAHYYYSQCLAAMGRFDEAIAAARRAQRLDPLSPLIAHYIGRIHYFAHEYDKAIATLTEALDIDRNYAFTHIFLASTYERMRDYDRALRHRQTYLSLIDMPPEQVAELGVAARASGYKAALRVLADRAAAAAQRRGYVTSSELAYVLTESGDVDKALGWLERAVDDHVRDLIYLKVEPGFDSLRANPKFTALVSRAIP